MFSETAIENVWICGKFPSVGPKQDADVNLFLRSISVKKHAFRVCLPVTL